MKTTLLTLLAFLSLNAFAQDSDCYTKQIKGPYDIAYAHPDSNYKILDLPSVPEFEPGDSIVFFIQIYWYDCAANDYVVEFNTNYISEYPIYSDTKFTTTEVYDAEKIENERLCGIIYNTWYQCAAGKQDYIVFKSKVPDEEGRFLLTSSDYRGSNKSESAFRVKDTVTGFEAYTETTKEVLSVQVYNTQGSL